MRELPMNEIEEVSGRGPAPVVWAAAQVARCVASKACENSVKVGGFAAAGAAAVGYGNNKK
ncbi:MAG: hypothetical protein L3J24_04450 [Xanthomonadales bacterium]|nr:hypothetical protein [Xanthomonadales bacterium]